MIAIMTTDVITKLILNTWEPYIIKYPSPAFETSNSPMMTPTKDTCRKRELKAFWFKHSWNLKELDRKS